jgi:DNA-binding MarR family transcriptional regulator
VEAGTLAPFLDRMEEVSRRFFRYVHNRIQTEGGLTPSQFFLLKELEAEGALTVTEAAQRLGTTVAGATGLLDRMARSGLIERSRDEADRRLVWVRMSSTGAALLTRALQQRREIMAELFQALTPAELAQLVALYEKVARALPAPGAEFRTKE